jgi:hypothetical protein
VSPSGSDPFRWWHTDGWQPPVISDLLYRHDEWVTTFLNHLDAELAKNRPATVRFEADRPALVVTGATAPGTLRTARAKYRDVVLFHPRLHPDLERRLDTAVVAAATKCVERNFSKADALRLDGRELLLTERDTLLHPDVHEGLCELGLSGLPPFGVSGVVEVQSDRGTHVVASLRSDRVAVNPACLGPSVDGGLGWTASGIDPQAGLRREIEFELPWSFEDGLELVGTLLPPAMPTWVADTATHRCGVNVVYRTSIERDVGEVLRTTPHHFEAKELMLIDASEPASPAKPPQILALRYGRLAPITELPPLSEVLVAALSRRKLVQASTAGPPPRPPIRPVRSTKGGPAMSSNSSTTESALDDELALDDESGPATSEATPAPAHPKRLIVPAQLTLDDAWAKDLIERHSRLDRVLRPEALAEFGETEADLTLHHLGPIFDAVREFEFVKTEQQIKASDDARLFEALVYRVGRYLFDNNQKRALEAHDAMLSRDKSIPLVDGEDPNPIGTAYSIRLENVIAEDEKEDPDKVWREAVGEALNRLNQNEAVQEYAEVARRGRLLCFCAALWCLETKRDPLAATVALDDRYRKSLSGEVIALFFRARALLTSPVISAAQAQLGLQFVTTSLAVYEHNPGMHHTKAIFLLRQSALTEIEAVSLSCLNQALQSVETALEWDAEFPKFYATRAKVKYRLKDRPGALIDIRAAIELARYSEASPVVEKEVAEWEALLEGWQLSPVGLPVT